MPGVRRFVMEAIISLDQTLSDLEAQSQAKRASS